VSPTAALNGLWPDDHQLFGSSNSEAHDLSPALGVLLDAERLAAGSVELRRDGDIYWLLAVSDAGATLRRRVEHVLHYWRAGREWLLAGRLDEPQRSATHVVASEPPAHELARRTVRSGAWLLPMPPVAAERLTRLSWIDESERVVDRVELPPVPEMIGPGPTFYGYRIV
jgi:hypothetical protein